MEKYRFNRKLQEAVLRRRKGKQPTVIINGKEMKIRCPSFVGAGTGDIPCLVERDCKHGSVGYNVLAVSFDNSDKEEKGWICIQPALLEQAIGFFIESNQMKSMTGDCKCVERLPNTRDSGFDFETQNALVEIKVPLILPNGTVSCIWKSFHQAVKQIIGYCNSPYCKEKGKRIILLTICQHGTNHILAVVNENTKKELEKAVRIGIEFWIAETKTEEDGISLLEHWNYTDKILKS